MEENKATKEIDVLSLSLKIIAEWKKLCICTFVGAILGVIFALCTPKIYTSTVTLAPEMNSGGLGMSDNLAEMASNFGIELGNKSSMDAIYPEIYPNIFATTDFLLSLYDVPVRTKVDNKQKKYIEHWKNDSKVAFWNYPSIFLHELLKPKSSTAGNGAKDPFVISRDDSEIIKGMQDAILCTIDKKTSIISISVTDQDPLVAAIMADTLQKRLQEYITDYRTKKARNDYDYYKMMVEQTKEEYEKSRIKYSSFADANLDPIFKSLETKSDDLNKDMQQKFESYRSALASMRAARAKIQERTPAFVIIERPIMPYKQSGTPRVVIVFLWMLIAIIACSSWILYKDKKENKNKTE